MLINWALWVFQCNFLDKVYSIVGKIIWKAEAASSLRTIINYVVKSCHVRSQKVWFVTQQTVGKKEQGVLVVIVVGSTRVALVSLPCPVCFIYWVFQMIWVQHQAAVKYNESWMFLDFDIMENVYVNSRLSFLRCARQPAHTLYISKKLSPWYTQAHSKSFIFLKSN